MPAEMWDDAREVYRKTRAGTYCLPKDGQEVPDDATGNWEHNQGQSRTSGKICWKIQVSVNHIHPLLQNISLLMP